MRLYLDVADGHLKVKTDSGAVTTLIPAPGGTVTGVTATSPLSSSGGTAPAISIANQNANLVLAGPTSGGSGAVTGSWPRPEGSRRDGIRDV